MKWNILVSTNGRSEFDSVGNFTVSEFIEEIEALPSVQLERISFSNVSINIDQLTYFWHKTSNIGITLSKVYVKADERDSHSFAKQG